VDEIPPDKRKIVEIAGRSIGVFNVDGEFFALRNRCPHQGGPLCIGPLGGFVSSSGPGDYSVSRRGEILRCPWHGWEFDIRTGQSWFDPRRVRVRSYDVSLEVPDAPESGGCSVHESEPQPGPYLAETYPVTVERALVVVDVPD
jgi:3-phenylpropionate/trans-cinnamate dioxygenase ferredoxin subunit